MDERPAIRRAGAGFAVRVVAWAALAIAILGLSATPASAHTASGPRPTNYRSSLVSISPRIPGVTVQVVELGNKLEVTNRTAVDLVVLGHVGEPYLRVGPRGFYENLRSADTYLNRTRAGTTAVPAIARGTGASTPPRWHRVSGSNTAIWHDHHIHWMGTSPPPVVQRDPGAFHTINPQWTVVFRYAAQTVVVHGRLDWVPGPSGWPWAPFVAALFAAGLLVTRVRPGRTAIAAIIGLVGIDAAHTISAEVARAGAPLSKTLQFFGDNFVSVIVWIGAAFTIWGVRRRRIEALYGILLVGAMVGLASGLTDLSYLWKSQLPTVGPDLVSRAEVATAFGLGLGLAAGALLELRGSISRVPKRVARDPLWLGRLVAGLDDDELAVVCSRMDAGEVVPLALADVADRIAPLAAVLGSDALVFVVLAEDEIGSHVWSIVAAPLGSDGLRIQRGRPAPARAELRVTFPAFLLLLAGSLTVNEAIGAGRLDIDGDRTFVATLEPSLAESEGRRLPAARGR